MRTAKPREIPREPNVPRLSRADIAKIAKVVFVRQNPKKSDVLFVFGSPKTDYALVAALFKKGLAPHTIVNGYSDGASAKPQHIAHGARAALVALGIPRRAIVVQEKSTNTLADVREGKRSLERAGIAPRSILFVSKAHHGGRCLRTLRKHFPGARISAATYDAKYRGVTTTRATWWKKPIPRARVYGEYLRILRYAERGDIA